jgi:isopenicillin N synthase-like dioxygenase
MTSTTAETCKIPSVNLEPFFRNEGVVVGEAATEAQLQAAATIHKACQEHGFVHVTHFGIDKQTGERLFEASKQLFDHPTKHEDFEPWHPSHNTGYSPFRNEALNANRPPDLKEAFNVRFPPCYANPSLAKTPQSFQDVVNEDFFNCLKTAAIRYGMACALSLELPIDFFSKTLNNFDCCTVRFLHYPPCEFEPVEVNKNPTSNSKKVPIRVGEHTDFGAYTFLLLGKQGPMGLQVKSVTGGEVGGSAGGEDSGWKNVVIPDLEGQQVDDSGSFGAIINTGSMLARWTNDHWNATAHRVIVPDAEAATKDRYSIAFFVDPDAHELIEVDRKFVSSDNDGEEKSTYYEPITSKDFLLLKLKELADGGAK